MAIPVLPLVLLGAGVLFLRSRRARTRKSDDPGPSVDTIQTVVFVPPPTGGDTPTGDAPEGPSGEPGEICDAEDGEGAWDEEGYCKTFWIDGATDDAIAQLAVEEWEKRGSPGFSDFCLAVPDPLGGELGAPYKDNPQLIEVIAACLQRYYGVGGQLFPPTQGHGGSDPASPYWVHKAWAKASTVVRRELCGA